MEMPECIKNEDGDGEEAILRDIIYVDGMQSIPSQGRGQGPSRLFFFLFFFLEK